MDTAHLKNLKSILLSTQQNNCCVFFRFLSLKKTVNYLLTQLLKSDDVLNQLNYKQMKWIYKALGDYNYYPRCALCNQIIDVSSVSENKRKQPDNPLSFSWDHIFPKSHGGNTNLGNLQPTHKICNNKKSDKILSNRRSNINIDIDINIKIDGKCCNSRYKQLRPSIYINTR